MTHPESHLQQACVKYFRLQYPQYLIYANPNGGKRNRTEAAIMKAEGVTAGVPDLTIVVPGKVMWIEMKTPAGRGTDNQIIIMGALHRLGMEATVCRSLDEFIEIVTDYIGQPVPVQYRKA